MYDMYRLRTLTTKKGVNNKFVNKIKLKFNVYLIYGAHFGPFNI